MDWTVLIIPLIAAAVWIVSNLANQKQEPPRLPRVPTPPPRPRRVESPIPKQEDNQDSYRQEMDRKRDKRPAITRPVPKPRPRRSESAPKPPPLVLTPVPEPAAPVRYGDQPISLPSAVLVTVPIAEIPAPVIKVGQAAVVLSKPIPAAVKNTLDLLKKPSSLATAVLLKEILDKPVSKRRRRV